MTEARARYSTGTKHEDTNGDPLATATLAGDLGRPGLRNGSDQPLAGHEPHTSAQILVNLELSWPWKWLGKQQLWKRLRASSKRQQPPEPSSRMASASAGGLEVPHVSPKTSSFHEWSPQWWCTKRQGVTQYGMACTSRTACYTRQHSPV